MSSQWHRYTELLISYKRIIEYNNVYVLKKNDIKLRPFNLGVEAEPFRSSQPRRRVLRPVRGVR